MSQAEGPIAAQVSNTIGKGRVFAYTNAHEPERLHYLLHYYRLTFVARGRSLFSLK